ncbi:VanZ family protein [Bacillus sp. JJ1532]
MKKSLKCVFDEAHQIFVPGRGAHLMDVIIDSAGAIMGIGMYVIIGR